jgi:hypothetical protein
MSDHANETAATTAGWRKVQTDRGAGSSPRYITRFEKNVGNVGNRSSAVDSHQGESDVSQAAADTAALAALNGGRKLRYGAGATAGTDGRGTSLTFDS